MTKLELLRKKLEATIETAVLFESTTGDYGFA